ncbi:CTP synthase [candidate division TM6 bacterium RIFCSPHIGHO2_12_FULL_36_22]|nr:MAG: CTP synthase [candidate division TM6 bacterium RIFCSPHIGHO2_12_FULL_36_22]
MPKFIFVVGGVMSSVGKGVTAASIATLIQSRGFKVTNVKCDMYVNIDAGTIRPTEHGEVFIGTDGIEADQDLGNYERFTGNRMTALNYITTGQVYQEVIKRERNLEYNGEDVEVVPDIPNEIIRRIRLAQGESDAEVTVVEFGGTVGEYQLLLFLEAARMMKLENPEDVSFVLVSYMPLPAYLGEMKTKPTQYAVRTLQSAGIQPDFIVARGECALDEKRRETLAHVCNLKKNTIIAAPDVNSIYDVPVLFAEQNLDTLLLNGLGLLPRKNDLDMWKNLSRRIAQLEKGVKIGVVGKYFTTGEFNLSDSYISVIEAIKHACWDAGFKPELTWIDAQQFEDNPSTVSELAQFDGIVVPGGFGERAVEGILSAIRYAREHKMPYLGLCYGMQLACIEFARNVLGIQDATTMEIDETVTDPIITLNDKQSHNIKQKKFGATMRLGSYDAQLKPGSKTHRAYGKDLVSERHRHRYEFNNAYRDAIEQGGLSIVGINPDSNLVEVVELQDHPFFVATQFHPEFQSRAFAPHPLFKAFIDATQD